MLFSTVRVSPLSDHLLPLSGEGHDGAQIPYRPWQARITSIIEITDTEKLFEFRLIDERIRDAFHHVPGQFCRKSVFSV